MRKRTAPVKNRASLTDKRMEHGRYTVLLTCACGHSTRLAFRGWTASVCDGCDAEIERPRYRANARMGGGR